MGRPAKSLQPAYGRHLAELRQRAGLTQKQVADKVGVQQSNIAFWERSAKPPRGEVLPDLAKALGVTLAALLDTKSERPAAHRGPASRLENLVREISGMPKRKQQKIADVIEALVAQERVSSS